MKINVDWDLCEGNGLCAEVAPEVFELDDDDQLHLLTDQPPERLRDAVVTAQRRCPKIAIRVQE